ncbi:hypothetical protein DXG01_013714 [Tephrocybe rancida]|nr:hypothetical protein DXG01_013714 [Tephrocybe rancida]
MVFRPDPCSFLTANHLNPAALVEERRRHQTKENSAAIRQLGREWAAPPNVKSLQDQLRHRLQQIVSEKGSSTSGVGRQVRHTGTFVGALDAPARQMNKETAQNVAASAFLRHRATAFQKMQGIHENIYLANILHFNPLLAGHFVIALRPAKKGSTPELLIGEIVTMYTKANFRGAKHEAARELKSVGHASYIYIQLYTSFGPYFTSLACQPLSSSTFLQIPRTHIIFSLAGYAIAKQELRNADAHLVNLITLRNDALQVHSQLAAMLPDVNAAVQLLKGLTSTRKASPVMLPHTTAMDLPDADQSDSSSESDGD